MDYRNIYPSKSSKKKQEFLIRRIILITFAIAFVVCGIVNICVKGNPWSLLVLVSEWVFWVVFVERPLVENSLVIKLQKILTATSICLVAILWFLDLPQLFDAILIVLSSGQIFVGIVLLLLYKNRTKNTFKLAYLIVESITLIACLVLSIINKNWYQFLLFGLAMSLLLVDSFLYRKEIIQEAKKRFYLK